MGYIVQLCTGKKSWSYDGGMRARGFKILHPSRWTMLSLGRSLSTTNISYAIIRCTVAPTVSPAWSQGMPGTYIIYIVRHLCLSRGLEWTIRVYARRQGTTFWFILYRTMYVPLFNYNILTDIPIPADIIPSPPQSRRRAHPQRYTQQLPPIISYLLISAHTRHPDPKQSSRNQEWLVSTRYSRVFFS